MRLSDDCPTYLEIRQAFTVNRPPRLVNKQARINPAILRQFLPSRKIGC